MTKLSDRSSKMVLIGYESGTKGYRLFDPTNGRLVVSRDVIFDEHQAWTWTCAENVTAVQETETFTVHYELTDGNPTIGDDAVFPAANEEGEALLIRKVLWAQMQQHLVLTTPKILSKHKIPFGQHHQVRVLKILKEGRLGTEL